MAKSMEKKQAKLPLIDSPHAPDLYADEAIGFLLTNNTVRITFASVRDDHTKIPSTRSCVVSGRLVMPIAAAESLHKLLGTMLNKIKPQKVNETGSHTLQ